MSKSKAKGTAAESAVVGYLAANGFPHAERRTLSGAHDKGDVAGIPHVCIEVKSHAEMRLAAWLDEATVEGKNAGADVAVVFHKRRGKGSPAEWYVSMSGAQFVDLLRQAGR